MNIHESMPHADPGPGEPVEPRRRNTSRLRQSTIDQVRTILGTKTETESIEQALDHVISHGRMRDGTVGMGIVDVIYPDDG